MDTFVVRVFRPSGAEEGGEADASAGNQQELRGIIQHVASGTEATFDGAEAAIALMRAALATGQSRQSIEYGDQ